MRLSGLSVINSGHVGNATCGLYFTALWSIMPTAVSTSDVHSYTSLMADMCEMRRVVSILLHDFTE